jgi:FKBP-type peptidyl-prolyl cis-trans isomerase 2
MKKTMLFGLLLIGLLLFGCILPPNPPPVDQNTTVARTVVLGDTVYADYTLRLENGSVVDTSVESVAKSNNIYDSGRQYAPLGFKAAQDSGMINGFALGVIGMKINETKEIVVKPEDGYGLYDPSKVSSYPLFYNISRFETVPRKALEAQNITIAKNTTIHTDIGYVAITDFNDENVTLEYQLFEGQLFTYNKIPQIVKNVTNDSIWIMFDFEKGYEYPVPDGNGGYTKVMISDMNTTHFTVDANNKLAGKTLYFTVTVRSIQ